MKAKLLLLLLVSAFSLTSSAKWEIHWYFENTGNTEYSDSIISVKLQGKMDDFDENTVMLFVGNQTTDDRIYVEKGNVEINGSTVSFDGSSKPEFDETEPIRPHGYKGYFMYHIVGMSYFNLLRKEDVKSIKQGGKAHFSIDFPIHTKANIMTIGFGL